MSTVSRFVATGKRVASDVSEKNVPFMAAGIAYNAFVSLVPLLLLLLLVVSAVGGGLEDRLVVAASGSLPTPIADVVRDVFQGGSEATGASFIGLVVLLWGTLKVFRGLDTAFSEIYETERSNSFLDQLKDGLVVLVALVAAIVATVGASIVFSAFSDVVPALGVLTPLVLLVGLILAFLPMYYRFPDADLDWSDVLPGVVFAAVAWAVLQALFQVYLAFKGGGSESFFGGVILVVTWLYLSGIVLLIGAVINATVGRHSTGAPGGVGRGAASFETEREESLNSDELARYLGDLREDLTGRYGGMRPARESNGDERRPRPAGDVELLEQSSPDDEEEEWTVLLRWRGERD